MKVDDYTRLKPYKPLTYSPIKRLARAGELAILLDDPRGYCVVVQSIYARPNEPAQLASVRFLDETNSHTHHTYPLQSLIPTGKTPQSIIQQYEPSPVELDAALDQERKMPDLTRTSKKKGGGATGKSAKPNKKKFDMTNLTNEEKDKIATFIKALLQQ